MLKFALLAFALGGCAGNQTTIWLIDVAPTTGASSDTSCTESFIDGECPVDATAPTSDWTTVETSSYSDMLFFAEVIEGPGKDGWLVVQGSIVPGIRDGKSWTFIWDDFSEGETVDTHTSGYFYREYAHDATTTTMTMTADGGARASGTMHVVSESTDEYGESDTWNADDVGMSNGQLRAYNYLQGNASNDSQDVDCTGDCQITLTATSTIDMTFTATATHADEDSFDAIQDAGGGN